MIIPDFWVLGQTCASAGMMKPLEDSFRWLKITCWDQNDWMWLVLRSWCTIESESGLNVTLDWPRCYKSECLRCYRSECGFDVTVRETSMLQSEWFRCSIRVTGSFDGKNHSQSAFDGTNQCEIRIEFRQFIIGGWLGVALSNPLVKRAS